MDGTEESVPAAPNMSHDASAREEALREILEVISQSRDDEEPVFHAILSRAAALCDAPMARLHLVADDRATFRAAAFWGEAPRSMTEGEVWPLDPSFTLSRTLIEGETLHLEDHATSENYLRRDPVAVRIVEEEGIRTRLSVPLMQGDQPIGSITLSRREVEPFSADQISLVEAFAAQAVIAIENVRQFRELQTRLEREAATREILEVISESRDDEGPVFDTILDNVSRLCNAPLVFLSIVDASRKHLTIPAHRGARSKIAGVWDTMIEPLTSSALVSAHAIRDCRAIHVPDLSQDPTFDMSDARRAELVELEDVRSYLVVPLRQGDRAIGTINLYRREVTPFTKEQIVLVETFAAQAVIAIENVRQFRELQTRLEQEKASAEILKVISQSRDDEQPVFDVVLKNALKLCDVDMCILMIARPESQDVVLSACAGQETKAFVPGISTWPLDAIQEPISAIRENRMIHTEDMRDTELYRQGDPSRRGIVDDDGMRSRLVLPLISGRAAIGSFVLFRKKVRRFSDEEIAVLTTFAAQAVIAIENVRQFRELQTRLEREAATREILQIISRSRDDEMPVFDVILENAARICRVPFAGLHLAAEDHTTVEMVAHMGMRSMTLNVWNASFPIDGNAVVARCTRTAEVIHVEDMADDDLYRQGYEPRVQVVDVEGVRTLLAVPLVRDGVGVGCIWAFRREVSPFSVEDIDLLQGFAAQAVIAIENVRQFKALESRTNEVQALNESLEERVEKQVGEIERMGRLKRFLPAAVADTVVSQGSDKMLSSHRALLGVLFCDIRGFTAFCETAEPEETIEVLQTYHQEMGRLINDHGAGVDHRMGDGIMVLFNDPLPCEDPAGEAVRLALAMRDRMEELCMKWKRLGHRLGFGVGISLGYATVGMVGYEGRYDYTASGTAVNIAARLCDHAEDGEILLSPRAWTAVEDRIATTSRGEVSFKGINREIEVMCIEPGTTLSD